MKFAEIIMIENSVIQQKIAPVNQALQPYENHFLEGQTQYTHYKREGNQNLRSY